ncbi:hypothetical protein WN943_000817 [Citrus x changshan-huyou]
MLVLLTFQDGSSGNCDPTVIPTPQNLEGNSVDRNMYPHGIMDYCNDLMNLYHVIGDSVYPTSTQNSCTAIQWPRLDLYLGKKFHVLYRRGAGALATNGLQAMGSSWRRGHNKAETDVDSLTAKM